MSRTWVVYALGFVAGFAVASWLTLSVLTARAQSPEVRQALVSAADAYGVPYTTMSRLAWCESRYDPAATSWAGAMGLMQFMPHTWWWASQRAGYGGHSAYDPWAAAHTAAWLLSQPGGWAHWRACW